VRRSKEQWQGCEDLKAKVRKITLLLEKQYGIPRRTGPGNPLDILIETILSQNTHDQNRDKAYQRLKARFPRWEDVLESKTKSIVSAIQPGGLAEQKASRIREILHWIKKREGRLSLSFLKEMDSEEIRKTMGVLNGIGPKPFTVSFSLVLEGRPFQWTLISFGLGNVLVSFQNGWMQRRLISG
jgi:endonuclease-3